MYCGLLLLLVLNAMSADASAPNDSATAAQKIASPHVLVIAHRGDSGHFPENTLPSFHSAVRIGADLVELDYYHSADGVPIVFHDKTLERTTNATAVLGRDKIPVVSLTLPELRRLDAGSWLDVRFGGTPIPSLDEALDVIQQGSMTLIERKGGDAATCVKLLREKHLLNQVVVQSFDWDFVSQCHRLAPDLVVAALGSKELTEEKLDQIQETGSRIVGWDQKEIGRKQIQAIHRRGLRAWVYTVNDPRRAEELIDAGIDGIITDLPAEMLRLRKSR